MLGTVCDLLLERGVLGLQIFYPVEDRLDFALGMRRLALALGSLDVSGFEARVLALTLFVITSTNSVVIRPEGPY